MERTKQRVVWASGYKEKGKTTEGIRVVWLHPPDSWNLDICGDQQGTGNYNLTAKGRKKTRLDMKFRMTYESEDEVADRKKWENELSEEWDIFAGYLEKDYKESIRADPA